MAQLKRRKVTGQYVDLCSLYKAVTSRGGFLQVISNGLRWAGKQDATIFAALRTYHPDHDACAVRKVCSMLSQHTAGLSLPCWPCRLDYVQAPADASTLLLTRMAQCRARYPLPCHDALHGTSHAGMICQ